MQIEKDIPIPTTLKDLMSRMDVGDSLLYKSSRQTIYNIAHRLKPKRFTVRDTGTGHRVWRVE